MTVQRSLTDTVQEVINLSPEHKGNTVKELMKTAEGQALIDSILMEMRRQQVLTPFLVQVEESNTL